MEKKDHLHPYVAELTDQFKKGKVNRRDFIKTATLLGMSFGVASQIAGLSFAKKAFASTVQRGGVIKVASGIQRIAHPSAIGWYIASNQLRNVAEYLTYIDEKNITHPYLLEKWSVSDDLKTWTLDCRKGVTFNNGDEFTADDVIFTIKQWLTDEVGSALKSTIGSYLEKSNIEKINTYQLKLHLKRPELFVPEHLSMYQALILNHKTFEGDFIKAPHGTGPFTLETYKAGEIVSLKRRNDYWQKGLDGKPLPYLDKVQFIDMGENMSPRIAALKAGEIDTIDFSGGGAFAAFLALRNNKKDVNLVSIPTATVRVMRMRADMGPWKDNRVRSAIKLCQNREKIMQLAFYGEGTLGHDTHIAQIHPGYCPKPIPEYNPEKAKELLKQAGYPNGIDVTLSVGSGFKEQVRQAEIIKEDAAAAGFRIKIDPVPNKVYWGKWNEYPFSITRWRHRPQPSMTMSMAYTANSDGTPAKYNESHWVDKEFIDLLNQATSTVELEKRKQIFCKLEDIQMTRGTVGIPYWSNFWFAASKRVMNIEPLAHPMGMLFFGSTWVKA